MKVVKCLDNIPKVLWGKVIKDEDTIGGSDFKTLTDDDFFPLPEQGDKVLVSDDGTFKDYENCIDFFIVSYQGKFVTINEHGTPILVEYIRPVKENENYEPLEAIITFRNVPEGFTASSVRTGKGEYTIKLEPIE